MPIFSRERFDVELDMFYQNGSRASPAWLLSFYTILALGCLGNPLEEPTAVRQANEVQALELFRTGCKNISKVLFFNRDISGIQALLATVSSTYHPPIVPQGVLIIQVFFLWETQSTEGCFTLIGVITSIGSEIGLHRCGAQLGLEPREVDLRRNIFWVAYILDKDISLRIGRSSSIVDNDVTVKLPQGGVQGCSPRWFYHRAKLAKIVSKVSRLLCSQASTTLPSSALLGTIKMLDNELEEWRKGCEVMGGDEENLGCTGMIEALHNTRLRLAYFSCMGAIKRYASSPYSTFPA